MNKTLGAVLVGGLAMLGLASNATASLTGTYYNLDTSHPDMQVYSGGSGMVEAVLTGSSPTAKSSATFNQFDWWDSQYQVFQREDSDADLQGNFSSSWFPVNTGLAGDPYHFAVHWEGQFYVANDQDYTYSMGSDDDSWLFIDDQLVLDLGGVHAMSWANYTIPLTQGYHDIDIFFAERHTVQSGFQLNFFSDLEPVSTVVPEPGSMILIGTGLAGLALKRRMRRSA